MEKISQGAEARLYRIGDKIVKERFAKDYRIAEIDDRLRKQRTRKEARILDKLNKINYPCPKLFKDDDKQIVEMEFLDGNKVRDILEKSDYKKMCEEIGRKVAILHNNNIVHGDLTTSNMIMMNEIYFIDFGLSFSSTKIEDKAVDLHLLRQALESKHYTIYEQSYQAVLIGYKKESKDAEEVINRLETVEKRGRYKQH
jgi:TP53 regulating kinase-like protein